MAKKAKPKKIRVKTEYVKPTLSNYWKRPKEVGKNVVVNQLEIDKKVTKIFSEIEKRLGFKSGDWTEFAYEIAWEYHPELQLELHNQKSAGRKNVWEGPLALCLWQDVFDYLKAWPRQTPNSACANLAKQSFWIKMGMSKGALSTAYSKYIRPYVDENWYSSRFGAQVVKLEFLHPAKREKLFKDFKPSLRRGLSK